MSEARLESLLNAERARPAPPAEALARMSARLEAAVQAPPIPTAGPSVPAGAMKSLALFAAGAVMGAGVMAAWKTEHTPLPAMETSATRTAAPPPAAVLPAPKSPAEVPARSPQPVALLPAPESSAEARALSPQPPSSAPRRQPFKPVAEVPKPSIAQRDAEHEVLRPPLEAPSPSIAQRDAEHEATRPPLEAPTIAQRDAEHEVTRPPLEAPTIAQRDAELAAERALLEVARTALARGRAAEAMELLSPYPARFPRGQLLEEHEALMVQALISTGHHAQARARAAQFHRRFPDSMLAPAIDAAISQLDAQERRIP